MGMIKELIKDIPLPKLVKVHQTFEAPEVTDIAGTARAELSKPGCIERVKPGMSIAITVGSRGVANIVTLTRTIVEEVKKRGGIPFVVPAMGSHGGATAEGQENMLANLGVTEKTVGCPIKSSMEVVEVGKLDNGLAVLIDKNAYEADGIIIQGRVKRHTAYHGAVESGLCKMITIGLGKQKGADSCHAYSFKYMAEHVEKMAAIKIDKCNILFGLATIENAYDKVCRIYGTPAEKIVESDKMLLEEAKIRMPKLILSPMDVLVVTQIGKDCSGDGMDPNITGRYATPYASGGPEISKCVILDLTEATHGNANGMGPADFVTRKLFDKIDYEPTYVNALTSTVCNTIKIPMIMDTDKDALQGAVKTCCAFDITKCRMVIIKDTMHLGDIYISESMLDDAKANPQIEIIGEPQELKFDAEGNLQLAF